MHVIMLSTDMSVFEEGADTRARMRRYADLVDHLHVLVPTKQKKTDHLAQNCTLHGSGGDHKMTQFFALYEIASSLISQAKKGEVVVTSQDAYFLGLIAYLLRKRYGVGVELQVHGWEQFAGLRQMIAKKILPNVPAVRTVGARSKERLVALGVPEKNITVISVSLPSESDSSQKEKIAQNNFIFFTASRLVPVKDVVLQLRALAALGDSNVRLRIAGDGPERAALEKQANDLGIAQQVDFLGWIDQYALNNEYTNADVFLFTSQSEGWGRAVLEAARKALPIISTNVGCVSELFTHEKDVLIIPVEDAEALTRAMKRLMDDARLGTRLGEEARMLTANLPTAEQAGAAYLASWKQALYTASI